MTFVSAFCAKTADIQVAIKLKLDYCKGINTGGRKSATGDVSVYY